MNALCSAEPLHGFVSEDGRKQVLRDQGWGQLTAPQVQERRMYVSQTTKEPKGREEPVGWHEAETQHEFEQPMKISQWRGRC